MIDFELDETLQGVRDMLHWFAESEVRPVALAADRAHAFWLFTVLVERREDFIRKLLSRDVPASVVHLRIDRYKVFGGLRRDLEGQTSYDERQVSIPVHEGLTDDDVQSIIAAIRSGW